jgi:Short C-terminal domain
VASVSFLHRSPRKEADATISHVVMLKRINYGTATVRVTYSVHPVDEPSFDLVHEAKVKMATLPQAGQQVTISYDADRHDRFDVLTPPGRETGIVVERTKEIPLAGDRYTPYATEGEIQQVREQIQQRSDPTLEKLKQLGELRGSGVLTDAEFEAQKARILAQD